METQCLKDIFSLDDEKIIQFREKQLSTIETKPYPKIGKINLAKYDLLPNNVKYIKEEKVKELPDNIKNIIDDFRNIIVVKDGNIIFSNLDDQFKSLKVMSYYEALKQNDTETLNYFYENFTKTTGNKFQTINYAYQNSALFIHVPKKQAFKEAIKIHVIGEKCDLVHHTIIVGDESSELTVLEKIDNIAPIHVNYLSDVYVLENAKINYIGIDRLTSPSFIERTGYVKDDGSLIYALGQLNDGDTVSNNHINLLGKNAYCETRNVLFTDKENMHAVTVNIEHFSPNTIGHIKNHGIVKDKGLLHVDGIGKINQGMKASNSQQQTRIITLSPEVKVTANPYLLIDEFDVLAGHGAGIGKVDEEQLYYLMSRGLPRKEAEKLVILGFLYPIIEMIDSEKIKMSFIETIEKKLSI